MRRDRNKIVDIQGAFFFISLNVKSVIQRSSFRHGTAKEGGAIYISGCKDSECLYIPVSDVTILTSKIEYNYASNVGGGIYASSYQNVYVSGCIFTNNTSLISATDILAEKTSSDKLLVIETTTFTKSTNKNSIQVHYGSIEFKNSQILLENAADLSFTDS